MGSIKNELIAKSRAKLQNPYAHLNDEGAFDAHWVEPYYSDEQIEMEVRKLHKSIWNEYKKQSGDIIPKDPISLLDPSAAIGMLGYDYEVAESLGHFVGSDIEVAGLIDLDAKKVSISRQFPNQVRRFTAAHELAHLVLHYKPGSTLLGQSQLHRDRALDGSGSGAPGGKPDPIERSADKFAAWHLMPERLVTKVFYAKFHTTHFKLTQGTMGLLRTPSFKGKAQWPQNRRELAKFIAACEFYAGKNFQSLADQFGVSIGAMAIRLEELELV
jgi:Zn-dependent peptidase ImmA (M78 family)